MTVYSGTKGGFRKPASVDGARIIPVHSTDRVYPVDNWFFNRSISAALEGIEADVFEAHTVSGYGFIRALIRNKKRTPFIHTVHGVLADEHHQAVKCGDLSLREKIANRFMWRLSRLEAETAQKADLVVTVSRYSQKKIVELYGVDKAKIKVVPNGVDPEKFKPFQGDRSKVMPELHDKQVVLFVGRLIPRKGLLCLVKAAKGVVKENPETFFVIVGNGPLRDKVISLVHRLNLSPNFKFMGDVKEEDLPLIYGSADIFALPSIQEGQGIALLEAQACGKPVVAFNVSAVQEVVADGKSGLLVETANSAEFANAILKLLSDKSLRENMGSKGRNFVAKNFTWDICASEMLSIYRQVLESD